MGLARCQDRPGSKSAHRHAGLAGDRLLSYPYGRHIVPVGGVIRAAMRLIGHGTGHGVVLQIRLTHLIPRHGRQVQLLRQRSGGRRCSVES
jgi:hypothetical protein